MRVLRLLWIILLGGAVLATAASAQDEVNEDFQRFGEFAKVVEQSIDSGTSSSEVLDALRARLVEFRTEFDGLRNANADRIAILRQQLAALGPPPEGENATEAADVAAKRAEINEQLAALLAPVQKAEAEYLRADALIGQIDQLIRARDTDRLLTHGPTPLNPTRWPVAIKDLVDGFDAVVGEYTPGRRANARENLAETLPIAIGLTLVGLLLIVRGRRWSNMLVGRLRRNKGRGFGTWRFMVSLLRILIPFTGFILLVLAVISYEVVGEKGEEILFTFAMLAGVMLGYRWVSERVFSRDDDEALILLPPEQRREIRFHVSLITVLLASGVMLNVVLEAGSPSEASAAVLEFPILLLAAFPLMRIGILLRGYRDPEPEGEAAPAESRGSSLRRLVRLLGTGAVIVAVVSPLLAAAGYFEFARAIFTPYVLTLVLLGLVMALQRFLADIYSALTRQGESGRETLLPVLFGLLLLLAVSPLIALAWGARVTDLTELWAAIGRGFAVGEVRITPGAFLTFAIIFAIGYIITRFVQSSLRTNVLPKTRFDPGAQNAIVSGLGYVGIFLAALAAITGAGFDLSSLAIVAGALSVGIGFGLQNIVSNFVSGIILLIERPISEGDWIEVGGQMGYVRDISVRSTRIETFDRTDVIVPNADLVSGTVTNYTRGNTVGRVIVPVGVAYGTDTRKVEAILKEIAEAQPMGLAVPPPSAFFVNFGADALEFEIRCFLRDVNWIMMVKSDINHAIAARFAEEGIEIPFAQRDLWLRNPETLRSEAGSGEKPA